MNLGENIYKLRTQKNMSQGDLAEALDVSRQSVSKWENNSAVPELEKLIKMAHIFGITLDEMVSGGTAPVDPVYTPQAIPEAPPKERRMTTSQILGIVLAAFGGLCFVVFTVVGLFTLGIFLGIAIALPFLLCGLVCLLCKKNIGLKCAWAVYLYLWVISTVFLVGGR